MKKNEPSLEDIGLADPVQPGFSIPPVPTGKLRIDQLQRESETEQWNAANPNNFNANSLKFICGNCGTRTNGKRIHHASFGTELTVWVAGLAVSLLLIPFAIIIPIAFTIWRFAFTYHGCPECRAKKLIPASSPAGKKLASDYASQ